MKPVLRFSSTRLCPRSPFVALILTCSFFRRFEEIRLFSFNLYDSESLKIMLVVLTLFLTTSIYYIVGTFKIDCFLSVLCNISAL